MLWLCYFVLDYHDCLLTQNEIGWREISRKLLLFSTDAGFHFAGDGKVCDEMKSGITQPNIPECFLYSLYPGMTTLKLLLLYLTLLPPIS